MRLIVKLLIRLIRLEVKNYMAIQKLTDAIANLDAKVSAYIASQTDTVPAAEVDAAADAIDAITAKIPG